MRTVIRICFLIFIYFSTAYSSNAELNLQEDKRAQDRCLQQVVIECTNKCQQSGGDNCVQLCSENAKNECRQAGQ